MKTLDFTLNNKQQVVDLINNETIEYLGMKEFLYKGVKILHISKTDPFATDWESTVKGELIEGCSILVVMNKIDEIITPQGINVTFERALNDTEIAPELVNNMRTEFTVICAALSAKNLVKLRIVLDVFTFEHFIYGFGGSHVWVKQVVKDKPQTRLLIGVDK